MPRTLGQKKMEKKRHGCLATYLIFMMVVATLGGLFYLFGGEYVQQGNPEIGPTLSPVFATINFLMAGFAFGLWKWKRWAFWAFLLVLISGGALNIVITKSLFPIIFIVPGVLIFLAAIFIGKERKGWDQLE